MRKKHTFLLTILPSEEQPPMLRGRLQFIPTGSAFTFTNLQELQQLIESEIRTNKDENCPQGIQEPRALYRPVDPQHWDEKI
jgi:hypothetical protein